MTRRIATLLVALSLAAPAGAAPRPPAAAPPPPSAAAPVAGADGKKPGELRKEVLERMRAQRAWRIVEELKLDEAASARLFPILPNTTSRRWRWRPSGETSRVSCKRCWRRLTPTTARITAAVNRMLANRTKRHAFKDERLRELRKVLTPVQQGKLVLLLPRLEREFARSSRTPRAVTATTLRSGACGAEQTRTCRRRRRRGRRRCRSRLRSWLPSRAPGAGGSRCRPTR